MKVRRKRVLAISVRARCVSYVVFVDRRLKLWKMAHKAVRGPKHVESLVRTLIAKHNPDIVICEDPAGNPHKGFRTKSLMQKVMQVIDDEPVTSIVVPKTKMRKNMYQTAKTLAKRFPEIAAYLPQSRKFYETENRRVGYIEALSLSLTVIDKE